MNITNEQFFKLPKFAQREINKLRNDLDYHKKKIDEMLSTEPSNVQISQYPENKNLPNNSNIRFNFKDGNYMEISIIDEQIRVHGYNAIKILPRASNSIVLDSSE